MSRYPDNGNASIGYTTIEQEILHLKQKHNAVILAHYYQDSEIQDIADFVGDSLELSKRAQSCAEDVILFCGVKFMAETAKILNPTKTVLLPDVNAGCSLEQSCKAEDLELFLKTKHPSAVVISYINCSAEVKALSDIICTSSNAEKIVNSIPLDQEIVFAPDKHLGGYIMKKTGRKMTLWNGSCIIHDSFSEKELVKLIANNPTTEIIAHPECAERLLTYAKFIGSTSAMLKHVTESHLKKFIVLTEPGIIHRMKKNRPDATFLHVPGAFEGSPECKSCNNCPFMKLNTMEKVRNALRDLTPEISLSQDLIQKATKPLLKMLAL